MRIVNPYIVCGILIMGVESFYTQHSGVLTRIIREIIKETLKALINTELMVT